MKFVWTVEEVGSSGADLTILEHEDGEAFVVAAVSGEIGDRHDTLVPSYERANLMAAAPALYEALQPVVRGANDADYYCPDDVADDHTVLVSFTIAELRAARDALEKVSPQVRGQQNEGAES